MKATVEEAILAINRGDYLPCMPFESDDQDRTCIFCGLPILKDDTYFSYWDPWRPEYRMPYRREEHKEWLACRVCFKLNTFIRADGDCVCEVCGLAYSTHPEILFMIKLCSGQLVKL